MGSTADRRKRLGCITIFASQYDGTLVFSVEKWNDERIVIGNCDYGSRRNVGSVETGRFCIKAGKKSTDSGIGIKNGNNKLASKVCRTRGASSKNAYGCLENLGRKQYISS